MKKLRFSVRQLLLLVTLSAILMLGGILFHKRWLRRHVETAVPFITLAVEMLDPYTARIVAEHDVILDMRLDLRSNCAIVTCEYRNRDAAIRAVGVFDKSPALLSQHRTSPRMDEVLSGSAEELQTMLNQL